MFTKSERENFAAYGLIKQRNFLPLEKLANARNVIFQHLEQAGIWRNGGWSLDKSTQSIEPTAGMALLKPLWRHQTMIDLAISNWPFVLPRVYGNHFGATWGK